MIVRHSGITDHEKERSSVNVQVWYQGNIEMLIASVSQYCACNAKKSQLGLEKKEGIAGSFSPYMQMQATAWSTAMDWESQRQIDRERERGGGGGARTICIIYKCQMASLNTLFDHFPQNFLSYNWSQSLLNTTVGDAKGLLMSWYLPFHHFSSTAALHSEHFLARSPQSVIDQKEKSDLYGRASEKIYKTPTALVTHAMNSLHSRGHRMWLESHLDTMRCDHTVWKEC